MSLFGFVKDIGRKVFNKDEDAAEKIKEMVLANNPGVKNLEVEFDDGFVELCGDCESVDAIQKTVLMVGNVAGVKDVKVGKMKLSDAALKVAKAEMAAKRAAAEAKLPDTQVVVEAADVEYYTIVKGDTLGKIAKRFYGDPMKYKQLFEANREVIEDPDKIFPGQKIRVPKNLA